MATSHLRISRILFTLFLIGFSIAECLKIPQSSAYLPHQRVAIANPSLVKRQNTTAGDVSQAQKLVADAVKQQSIYNAFRIANPRRNKYTTRPSGQEAQPQTLSDGPAPPVLTDVLKAAAALVAEHAAEKQLANGTLHQPYPQMQDLPNPLNTASNSSTSSYYNTTSHLHARSTTGYWATSVDHGHAPMGWNPSYAVYRDVTQYGAKGDGVTDDTNAINKAIADGNNCGPNCLSSSTKGTFIYFPPGTYLISSPINAYYYSQLVGNPNNLPIIKTSASFVGLGAIQSDVYYQNGNGGEWYIVQSNFYRQVRNFVIDISQTTTASVAGLHWQVGQATSVTNVWISASTAPKTSQLGIFTENGSGGFMSDVTISGGVFGILGGNQQYTVRNFQITGAANASINLIWDWGWTWTGLYLSKSPIGILIRPQDPKAQDPGSTYIMDSTFDTVGTAVQADYEKFTILDTSIIILDNIGVKNVQTMVSYANGNTQNIPVGPIDFVVIGNVEDNGVSLGQYSYTRPMPDTSLLGGTSAIGTRNPYFTKSRPQYADLDASAFVNVKSFGAIGDGLTDDTNAIQGAINGAAGRGSKTVIYLPPGSYLITKTLFIPAYVLMTGQVWSQLVASGSYFQNMTSPQPMMRVGNPGDVGYVEISDILFTSVGALPGLIMVEWNVKGANPGDVGIWDSHFRIGGAYGTKLQVKNCPMNQPIQPGCIAGTMMLHIGPTANGYFENVWAWVADHDIDDAQNTQISVAVARGILNEASSSVWMYGTASEHSLLYQYAFVNSTNTFAGMIQTESPYFQATNATQSPGPYNSSIGLFNFDPVFPDGSCTADSNLCNFGWGVIAADTTNLTIAGAGLYSWFDNYGQSCVDTQNCQQRMVMSGGGNSRFELWNLITIGSVEMVSDINGETSVLAANNTQATGHPYWSALAGYLDSSIAASYGCVDDDPSLPPCVDFPEPCDFTQTFPDLDSLEAASDSINGQCLDEHALSTLGNMIPTILSNYSDVDNGYDEVFGYYADYTKGLIPEILLTVLSDKTANYPNGGEANQFFQCALEGHPYQACPLDLNASEGFNMTYKLMNSTGFFNLLDAKYGIQQDWIYFGQTKAGFDTPTRVCARKGEDCPSAEHFTWNNVPLVDNQKVVIPNPKDIVTAALPTFANISDSIFVSQFNIAVGMWNGSVDDLVQTMSVPVFAIQQAIANMANAKSIGQQQEKDARIKLILTIVSSVLVVVPFLDELAPVIGAFKGIFTIASQLASTAVDIASIAEDPSQAATVVFGMVAGFAGGGGRGVTEEAVGAAASVRRGLSDTDVGNFGKTFAQSDKQLQGIVKKACYI